MIKISDYIFKRLAETYKIKKVFMVTGGGAMHLNDSVLKNKEIQYICHHHEQACSIAAEGYYRSSGKLGVVVVTSGPGGTNTLTGLIGQWLDSVPTLYLSGQVKLETCIANYQIPGLRQIGDQEINIIDIVKPVTKFAALVKTPKEVRYLLDKALFLATNGRPGPVWLDIPLDIQGSYIDEKDFLEYEKKDDEITFNSNELDEKINKLIGFFKSSKRPIIIAGNGIKIAGGEDLFLELINKIKIPVTTSLNGFDILESDNKLLVGRFGTTGDRSGNFAVQNSDLFLSIGSRNKIRQIGYNWNSIVPNAKKIIVDIDNSELCKPTIKPDLAIRADARIFMERLLDKISVIKLPDYNEWLGWCLERKIKYPVVIQEYKKIDNKVHPYHFIDVLTKTIKEETIIITGNGSIPKMYFQAATVKKTQKVIWNSGCSTMGYDLPAAIGASIANPGKDIICLTGDGSIMMNIQELETISFYKLPIKIFILNNNGYISIRQTQDTFFNEGHIGCDNQSGLGFPEFKKISKAFNIKYRAIASNKKIENNIINFLNLSGPLIIEVFLLEDYKLSPRVSSEQKSTGELISKPLEDMYPFLSREEYKNNTLYDLKK